jgi:hypothetical protein
MRQDSLTALSCCLFDILGVTKETVLQAAGVANSAGLATLGNLQALVSLYSRVLQYQVSRCGAACSGGPCPNERCPSQHALILQYSTVIGDRVPSSALASEPK